jgi:hypothetical protein
VADQKPIVLPEQDDGPAAVLQENVITEITDTNFADAHLPKKQLEQQIAAGAEDWGDGFYVEPEPVLVTRNPDGTIARTTPLSEIPGVHLEGRELRTEDSIKEVESKETLVPLSRPDRQKLVAILTTRLCNYWKSRGPGDPRYNPYRDGLPELPSGSPEHLSPLPGTNLYPATDGQIYEWAKKFVADRTSVVDKRRFGSGHVQDLALRIE